MCSYIHMCFTYGYTVLHIYTCSHIHMCFIYVKIYIICIFACVHIYTCRCVYIYTYTCLSLSLKASST